MLFTAAGITSATTCVSITKLPFLAGNIHCKNLDFFPQYLKILILNNY